MAATVETTFGERDTTGNANGDFVCTGRAISALRMLVFWFIANGGTATALTSVTSPNVTWTRRVQAVDSGNNNRVEGWTGWLVSGQSSEVITTDGAGSYNRRSFVLNVIDGSDSDGATGGGTATDVDSSPADPTLSVDAAATSVVLAGLVGRGSGDTTEDGNTTQQYSSGSWAGFAFGERVWSRAGQGGATQLGSTGDDPLFWVMAGLEIKAAAGAPAGTPRIPKYRVTADLERYLKIANFIL
jgi:hypothetical protein